MRDIEQLGTLLLRAERVEHLLEVRHQLIGDSARVFDVALHRQADLRGKAEIRWWRGRGGCCSLRCNGCSFSGFRGG
ncbi:hypothetical protein, partial [Stutzerimonas balearica]|uniref:hypothetical protein n=1 Tax=Stutzerimonas balearica TaxID=74829 RepID=UPI0032B13E6C